MWYIPLILYNMWESLRAESGLRRRAVCCDALTSKSHGNARSPALVPKNQTNVKVWGPPRSQTHTHIHTQAQNTSLAPLFLTGLSTTHFLDCLWLFCYDCPRPLPIPRYCSVFDDYSLIKHLFEERWLILLFAGAGWWHGSSETVTRTRHHRGLSGKSFKNSLVTLIIKIYGNDMHCGLGE